MGILWSSDKLNKNTPLCRNSKCLKTRTRRWAFAQPLLTSLNPRACYRQLNIGLPYLSHRFETTASIRASQVCTHFFTSRQVDL